jgi:hypothetical protein
LTAGAVTNWNTFATALLAGFTTGDGFTYKPVIVSQRYSQFGPSIANVIAVPVTTTKLNTVLGMMRRRAEFRRSSI